MDVNLGSLVHIRKKSRNCPALVTRVISPHLIYDLLSETLLTPTLNKRSEIRLEVLELAAQKRQRTWKIDAGHSNFSLGRCMLLQTLLFHWE